MLLQIALAISGRGSQIGRTLSNHGPQAGEVGKSTAKNRQ